LIDIHSHVLFDLDDGPGTLEESLAMLCMAAEHGTTDLVSTPHADTQYTFDPAKIADRLARVREAVKGSAAESLRLYTGCDFHLTFDNIQDAIDNPRKYTVAQGPYLLVEFSDLLIFHNTAEIFARLRDVGMTAIVTHPERNGLLRQRIEEIAQWVEEGARVQVTGQSLTGGFGKRARDFCRTLLDRRLVHIIASDGHDCIRRPPVLDTAHAWLRENYGSELADALCIVNPGSALTGGSMELPLEVAAAPRKWYQIWR
jgi:protein-tyrosine phosphatase